MTLKAGVLMLKKLDYHHRNKIHFKIYSNRKTFFFKNVMIFHNVNVFTMLCNKAISPMKLWFTVNL